MSASPQKWIHRNGIVELKAFKLVLVRYFPRDYNLSLGWWLDYYYKEDYICMKDETSIVHLKRTYFIQLTKLLCLAYKFFPCLITHCN